MASDGKTLWIPGVLLAILGLAILVPVMAWKYIVGIVLLIVGIFIIVVWTAER
jgi:hypothetical protein